MRDSVLQILRVGTIYYMLNSINIYSTRNYTITPVDDDSGRVMGVGRWNTFKTTARLRDDISVLRTFCKPFPSPIDLGTRIDRYFMHGDHCAVLTVLGFCSRVSTLMFRAPVECPSWFGCKTSIILVLKVFWCRPFKVLPTHVYGFAQKPTKKKILSNVTLSLSASIHQTEPGVMIYDRSTYTHWLLTKPRCVLAVWINTACMCGVCRWLLDQNNRTACKRGANNETLSVRAYFFFHS